MSADEARTQGTRILGIDPGGTTGFCLLWRTPDGYGRELWQAKVTPDDLAELLRLRSDGMPYRLTVAVEDFVVGRRAARSKRPAGGQLARNLIGTVRSAKLPAVYRSANQAKTWATDRRMSQLFSDGDAAFVGKQHAKDAARHALYAAVVDFHWPDPLTRPHLDELVVREAAEFEQRWGVPLD